MPVNYGKITQLGLLPGFIIAALGWLLGTSDILTASNVDALNKFSLKLTIPFCVFNTAIRFYFFLIY